MERALRGLLLTVNLSFRQTPISNFSLPWLLVVRHGLRPSTLLDSHFHISTTCLTATRTTTATGMYFIRMLIKSSKTINYLHRLCVRNDDNDGHHHDTTTPTSATPTPTPGPSEQHSRHHMRPFVFFTQWSPSSSLSRCQSTPRQQQRNLQWGNPATHAIPPSVLMMRKHYLIPNYGY